MTAQVVDSLPPRSAEDGVTTLLVDDTPTLRMLMRLALEGTGFVVVGEAGDGLAALELARQLVPDLVLLDLAMPVMDGLEAMPLLREALPDVRVVILSGFDRAAMESQVLEAGADAYLQKGLAPEAMIQALREIFPARMPAPVAPPAPSRAVPPPSREADRLAAVEQDLEELLYLVSHDLSEPVNVIKGFAERLARRTRTNEEAEFCEFIIDSAQRMQQLLDDLLDFARAGRGELPQELLDCRRLVADVIAGLGSTATSGALVSTGELPRELVANRLVLTQVLHNLAVNALKFVQPGVVPHVRIEAECSPGTVIFRVSDNGVGIEPEHFDRIFQPFKRLHSRERYPGSGIGLAICRRLVERQGGRIWVDSGPSGSTFSVELPA
ncbi:MAG: response regulator [Mycobacteriales bacterium]|nr:response regulator [Mycobacteriales bacterium]